jgi:hypothetical protein
MKRMSKLFILFFVKKFINKELPFPEKFRVNLSVESINPQVDYVQSVQSMVPPILEKLLVDEFL